MSSRVPVYKTFIDWFGHGGLTFSPGSWSAWAGTPPTITASSDQSYAGNTSVKILYAAHGGTPFGAQAWAEFATTASSGFTASVWLYVPSGSPDPLLHWRETRDGDDLQVKSTAVKDEWVRVDFEEAATSQSRGILLMSSDPSMETTYFVGLVLTLSQHDDVSCDVLFTRTPPDIVYGRDAARDLSEIRVGEVGLELDNRSQKYTPGNPESPISASLMTNRQVVITAEYRGRLHVIYSGFTDDYRIRASLNARSVEVPCIDTLGRLNETTISTGLYPSIRTGDAVRVVLEAAGLPVDDSLIDSGATTLRWWSVSRTSALQVLNALVNAEGPPSLYTVTTGGRVAFRDRLHRQRASYPAEAVMELTGCDKPGAFTVRDDSDVNYSWRDVVNTVNVEYQHTDISSEYSRVWSQPGDVTWGGDIVGSGSRYTFSGSTTSGYYDAQNPIKGELVVIENPGPDETNVVSGVEPEDHDYVQIRGDVSLYSMTRSGADLLVTLSDNTAGFGSVSTVRDFGIRARAVSSEAVTVSKRSDQVVDLQGATKSLDLSVGPVTAADAAAIAELVLKNRAVRRPTVTAVLPNREGDYTEAQLSRDLSDPVIVDVEPWAINGMFAVEGMRHQINGMGTDHVTTYYLEQVRPSGNTGNPFTFDAEGQGFDDGEFAGIDISQDTVFILGSSELDSTDVLTY